MKTSIRYKMSYSSLQGKKIGSLLLLIATLTNISCKKFIELDPPTTSITQSNVYTTPETATAVLTGIYIKMSQRNLTSYGGITTLSFLTGLSADEFTLYSDVSDAELQGYYTNSINADQLYGPPWPELYNTIYTCNAIVEGVSISNSLIPTVKQQLLGEAKFLRAFNYFYLVNMYGDVPLVTTTNYKQNSTVTRNSMSAIYQQIIQDLKDAEQALSATFVDNTLTATTAERVRPNKWAAKALLARVYLYTKKYNEAESEATEVINNSLFQIIPLGNVFLKNSKESIWQLQPVNAGWNTEDARMFVIPSTGPDGYAHPIFLSQQQLNAFEPDDERKNSWVGRYTNTNVTPNITYYYPFKYKSYQQNAAVTEYSTVLRLSEQYLIRAEARAMQNNFSGASDDLFVIRQRAGLNKLNLASQSTAIDAILLERQAELFSEWGQRWFDLKRLNRIDAVMSSVTPLKGGVWSPTDQLYPIPTQEIRANSNLTQNPGY